MHIRARRGGSAGPPVRQSQGTERLRAARERFGALKAAPLVAEVDDLLACATSKTS